MAQLTQPTRIVPNLNGEIGSGVADVSQPIVFSWQVNGTAAMTKFRLRCYANTAGITGYRDYEQTVSPFYGRDENGNPVPYTYTLQSPWDIWANGNTCYYELKLWWGNTDAESIETLSKCLFLARKTPTLTISTISSPVSSPTLTVNANYAQAQGDMTMWVQWQLCKEDGDGITVIKDTGRMFGVFPTAGRLTRTFDGLANTRNYLVRCIVETENGVIVSSDWVGFSVSYTTNYQVQGIGAGRSCLYEGAVDVGCAAYNYIPITSTDGSPTFSGNELVMKTGDYIRWTTANNQDMNFAPPWSFIYRGVFPSSPGGVIRIYMGQSNLRRFDITFVSDSRGTGIVVDYNVENPTDAFSIASHFNMEPGRTFSVCLTEGAVYIYDGSEKVSYSYFSGVKRDVMENPFTSYPVTGIILSGPQRVNLVRVMAGGTDENTFYRKYATAKIADIGEWEPGTWFRFYPLQGNYSGPNTDPTNLIQSYSLYRANSNDDLMVPIFKDQPGMIKVSDYGCGATDEMTQYFMIQKLSNGERRTYTPHASPCYWSWILLSCVQNDNGAYVVQRAYPFKYNVSTTAMSNNNRPNIMENFTPFPLVQLAPSNYRSGTLQSLIGKISGCDSQYSDTRQLRDEIMALSTTTNQLFIKSRKGDLIMIRAAGEITMETGDNTQAQEQRMSFPWVEIGRPDGLVVYEG